MSTTRKISVKQLTRVEGHGNISITIQDGELLDARWEVVETPRLFEAMLLGKSWDSAPWICGRICGICSIGHTLASIRAIENAFGMEPSLQTRRLRLLLKHLETLQSHALHIFFLVMPDFLGAGSVFPLIESHPDIVRMAARVKQLANDGCDVIGGRRLHPTRTVVGGFTMLPTHAELRALEVRLGSVLEDLHRAAELFRRFEVPDFTRETEFVSLKGVREYPFIGGEVRSSDGVEKGEGEYRSMTNEYSVPGSTAKWCRLSRESYAVGALARVNNNFAFLHPDAREVAEGFELRPVVYNPFMATSAQFTECVHVVQDARRIITELLNGNPEAPREQVRPTEGEGTAAVEVPRGILYHHYRFDDEGRIVEADCVIPTGQNHGNIQSDLETLVAQMAREGASDGEIRRHAEMLVRAYDPCISCSVH